MKYIVVILLAALLFSLMAGYDYFQSNYIILNGSILSQDITQLDLSNGELSDPAKLVQLKNLSRLDLQNTGITDKQYRVLAENLPECEIIWSVPFQEQYYLNSTESLRITSLTEADVAQLSYFPKLSQIDASECEDYAALQLLLAQYPQCDIRCKLPVAGQVIDAAATSLSVQNPDLMELKAILPYFKSLQTVTLTGTLPSNEELHQLQTEYPNVRFIWAFLLCGVEVSTANTFIDLSNIPMESTREVEAALPCFNDLEKVIMCDCSISNEDMDLLGQRNPGIRFVWTVSLGNYIRLRTDATYLPPSEYNAYLTNAQFENLKYCVDMICLDLTRNNITDVSFLAYMPHLKYLLLGNTPVSDISACAGLQELAYVELFQANVQDYSPLLECPNLRDLNICYALPDNGTILCQLTQLRNLYVKEWELPYQEQLEQALTNTNLVFLTNDYSPTGNGWHELPNYYDLCDLMGTAYDTQ